MNRGNMKGMMKQVQKMQKEMEHQQEALAKKEYTGQAQGGLVEVVMTGDQNVQRVSIDPEIIDPEDKEIIEDLVLLAVNDAIKQINEESERVLGKYTEGLNLPGFGF